MKDFIDCRCGMGIGGWLTNYKRFNVLPEDRRLPLTVGDWEHFHRYITRRDVAYIASLGFDHIRLGFDQIVLEEAPGKYREEAFGILEDFVSWCEEYSLGVVLNLHKAVGNYCDIPEKVTLLENQELQDRFVALWLAMESHFAKKPKIAFELMNEIRDVDPLLWNRLAERTVAAIHKLCPERMIIIGSTCWNSPHTLQYLPLWESNRVSYTFHNYSPFAFTHQRGVLQADPLYYNREMFYPDSIDRYRDYEAVVHGVENAYPGRERMDISYLREELAGAVAFRREHPEKLLWCGEFGTIRHAPPASRVAWMRDVIKILKENDIPYCVWNYLSTPNDGNRFSLVDDDRREILSPVLLKALLGEE